MINQIDNNIVKLVETLNKMNFETIKSCEGHIGSDFHCSYPWIAFQDNSRINYLKRTIKEYNQNKLEEESWVIELSNKVEDEKIIYILKPKQSYKNLYFLQKQVMKLNYYLKKINVRGCF